LRVESCDNQKPQEPGRSYIEEQKSQPELHIEQSLIKGFGPAMKLVILTPALFVGVGLAICKFPVAKPAKKICKHKGEVAEEAPAQD